MSYKRIESAYATCLGDRRVTGTQLAVLLGLANCANAKNDDACYPSYAYLEQLTHFGQTTIKAACRDLKKLNLITWVSGTRAPSGNKANRYTFLFPHRSMPKSENWYESAGNVDNMYTTTPSDGASDGMSAETSDAEGTPSGGSRPTLSRETTHPWSGAALPSGGSRPTLGRQPDTNKERTSKQQTINSVSILERGCRGETDDRSLNALTLTVPKGFAEPIRGTTTAPDTEYAEIEKRTVNATIKDIMQICEVNDMDNQRVFFSEALKHDTGSVQDEICRFASEIRQGEHDNARNLAAIFMKRLQALPTRKPD